MRLIDADKLSNDVSKYFSQPNYHPDADAFIAMKTEKHNEYIHNFLEEIEQQPTVEVPQWIPCSERLPKNQTELWWCTTEYLTCSKDGTIEVLCYCDGWNCSFLNADMDVWRDNEIKDVIAWMPLPQPLQ